MPVLKIKIKIKTPVPVPEIKIRIIKISRTVGAVAVGEEIRVIKIIKEIIGVAHVLNLPVNLNLLNPGLKTNRI
jgi:hypothetical protein